MSHTTRSNRICGGAVEVGVFSLIAGVPLALGGVHQPAILLAGLTACLATLLLWLHRRSSDRGVRVCWFAAMLLGLFGYTVLQLVPLPIGLLGIIAPSTAEVLKVSLASEMPAFHPISLEPSATVIEAIKVGTCALLFLVAHNHFRRRSRRDRMVWVLVATAVLLAFLGFIGAVVAPGKPLFFYSARGVSTGLITTSFVNPNHSAAFLSIGGVLTMGLAVASRDLQRKVLLVMVAVLLGVTVFLTLSRGGIIAVALGLGLFALLLWWTRRGEPSHARMWIIPGSMALILVLALLLAFDAVIGEFRHLFPEGQPELGKIGLWPLGVDMARANAWVGVGRGAFLTAFPRYLSGDLLSTRTFSHIENQYLQLPIELGIPVGGGLIVLSFVAFVIWIRRGRKDTQTAAIAAVLLTLAAFALVDFNLEILGVALPVAALAGMLSAGSGAGDGDRRSTGRGKWRGRSVGMLTLLPVIGLAVLCVWAAFWAPPGADVSMERINQVMKTNASWEQTRKVVQEAVRRHPADYLPHLAGARVALRHRRPEALVWLNRAMFLNPKSPEVHLEAARALLWFKRRRQALVEYRLALAYGASVVVLARALPVCRDAEEVKLMLPPDPRFHAMAVLRLLQMRRKEHAASVGLAARQRWPRDTKLAISTVEVLLATGKAQRAVRLARKLARMEPTVEAHLVWARAMVKTSPDKAIPILQAAINRYPQDQELRYVLAGTYLKVGKLKLAQTSAEELLPFAISSVQKARIHRLLARVHHADGRPHRARYEEEMAKKLTTPR